MTIKRVTHTHTHLFTFPVNHVFNLLTVLFGLYCVVLSEVTYRCRKIVDKEMIDLEILDTVNKVHTVLQSGPHTHTQLCTISHAVRNKGVH